MSRPRLTAGASAHDRARTTARRPRPFARRVCAPSVAIALVAAQALGAPEAAAAPAVDPSAEPGIDRSVVVTATRTPQSAFDVLAPVVVIDREAVERSLATDVADLLRFHAGIELGRNGGPGQTTSLFVRGTDSNHTVVLVDGVRINPGTIGGAALQNVAPELVERIEIVKGPRSTLYGTDAIGGVVNVITRRARESGLQALAGYGRWDSRQLQLTGALAGEAGELTLAANSLESDGFPTRVDDATDRGYRNRSFALGARTEVGGVELGARWWRASGNNEYSDFFRTPVDQDFENSAAAVEAATQVTARWRTRVTLSRVTDEIFQNQPPFEGATEFDYALTRRNAIDWQNGVDLGAHRLTLGALLSRESTRATSFGSGFDVQTSSNTYYAQDQVEYGRHRVLLAAGYTDHDTFGGHPTWNAEYGLALGSGTLLTAAIGTAFRAPDATDRFGFGGNPDLDPERSRNVELGIRHRVAGHTLALSAFENRIDDLVQFVTVSFDPFVGENRNVDRARIRGVEASWEYAGTDWRARVEAIRQDPEDRRDGSRLLRRAQSSATLALARRFGPHELALDVLATGDREDAGFPARVRLGGYTVANLAARFALTDSLHVQARLENALDRRYALASGFTTMRRALMVAARYDFR